LQEQVRPRFIDDTRGCLHFLKLKLNVILKLIEEDQEVGQVAEEMIEEETTTEGEETQTPRSDSRGKNTQETHRRALGKKRYQILNSTPRKDTEEDRSSASVGKRKK